jgi:hypothetical protein
MSFLFHYLFTKDDINNKLIENEDYIVINKNEYNELLGYNNIFTKIKCIFEEKQSKNFFLNYYSNSDNLEDNTIQESNKEENSDEENIDNMTEKTSKETLETLETLESIECTNNIEKTCNIENDAHNENYDYNDNDTISTISSNEIINEHDEIKLEIKPEIKKKLLKKDYDILLKRKSFIKHTLNMQYIHSFLMYEYDEENKDQIINKELIYINNDDEITIKFFENQLNKLNEKITILNNNIQYTNNKINNIMTIIIMSLSSYMLYKY